MRVEPGSELGFRDIPKRKAEHGFNRSTHTKHQDANMEEGARSGRKGIHAQNQSEETKGRQKRLGHTKGRVKTRPAMDGGA